MSGALSEALVAAQRRAISALEKAYCAGTLDMDVLLERLDAIGTNDAVDQARLVSALDVIREHGAALPSEAVSNAAGATETPRTGLGDDLTWLTGKHKGQTLSATPTDYLRWYADNGPEPVARSRCRATWTKLVIAGAHQNGTSSSARCSDSSALRRSSSDVHLRSRALSTLRGSGSGRVGARAARRAGAVAVARSGTGARTGGLVSALIGREDSSAFGPDSREERRWIGKPWRRAELLTNRYFHKGEEFDRTRDLTLHFGLRRLGLGVTLIFTKASVLDYSEDTP